ncbi:MAG: GNAT family N-acetyltransferase [Sphingopyxis solisilvae]|uniref:GNAT family N-acetyltransferase n=1 Tax=Sphingopyxis solisilvae TaxID=1886788 RepID=UPI004036677A
MGISRVDITLEKGFATAIDAVADRGCEARSFLRTAWYAGTSPDTDGASTLLLHRADGTPLAALPTLPVGPTILGARRIPGSYWPFRSIPLAADVTAEEIEALVAHPPMRRIVSPFLRIGPVYDDDPALAALTGAARKMGWTVLRRTLGTSYRIDVAGQLAAGPWPRKSSQRRLRTYEKQLAAIGQLTIRHITGSDWSLEVLRDLATIEAKSWIGQDTDGSGAKFLTESMRAGWLRGAADRALADMLTATILYVGDRPVAFTFDMLCGDMQYGIAGSYDKEFAAHSPGKLVAYRQYDVALERGITTIDLGAGDSGYKRAQGAVPGPEIVDCLIVCHRALAALLRGKWEGGGQTPAQE